MAGSQKIRLEVEKLAGAGSTGVAEGKKGVGGRASEESMTSSVFVGTARREEFKKEAQGRAVLAFQQNGKVARFEMPNSSKTPSQLDARSANTLSQFDPKKTQKTPSQFEAENSNRASHCDAEWQNVLRTVVPKVQIMLRTLMPKVQNLLRTLMSKPLKCQAPVSKPKRVKDSFVVGHHCSG